MLNLSYIWYIYIKGAEPGFKHDNYSCIYSFIEITWAATNDYFY